MEIKELVSLAKKYAGDGKKWHFHILTPECMLNDSGKYALVLENSTDGKENVIYSEEPYMGVGEELVKLLHGGDVIKNVNDENMTLPSEQVKKILDRAKKLFQLGIFWHHHMLFPSCKFNKHGKKWVIVFEDNERGEIIESATDKEPKDDLQHIEGLFYSQKRI